MKKTKERGITLIALAVTIIVLLVLAGITINSLISNNGILKQSQTAVKQNKIQEYKQELTLILLEAQLESYASSDYKIALKNYVKTKIIEAGKYNIIDEEEMEDYIIVETKTEGYKYKVTLTEVIYLEQVEVNGGEQSEIPEEPEEPEVEQTWTQNGVNVTDNTGITLEVGSSVSGYTANNVSNWYVLGATDDGKLLLTTNENVTTVELSGQNGYTGGIAKLNTEAAKYTNSDYAEGTARSIKIEDINRVTGYNPDVAKYNTGTSNVYQWQNEVTYTKNASSISYIGTKYPTTSQSTSSYSSFIYLTGTQWKTLATGESSPAIINTFYGYDPQTLTNPLSSASSNAYGLLFANTSSGSYYWLGSKYVITREGYVAYGINNVQNGKVAGDYVCHTNR